MLINLVDQGHDGRMLPRGLKALVRGSSRQYSESPILVLTVPRFALPHLGPEQLSLVLILVHGLLWCRPRPQNLSLFVSWRTSKAPIDDVPNYMTQSVYCNKC